MKARLLRQIESDQLFALADLLLVILSGVIWLLAPELGVWVLLLALFPWAVRLLAGRFPFQRTSFDWLVAIFLATAWVGYCASYDPGAAWNKVWLIVLAVLLYYALAGQPPENLEWVCVFFFCIGVGVSIYFFLTHDFAALPRKVEIVNSIGRAIMTIRPELGWTPIHPNYIAGMATITTPFMLYPARKLLQQPHHFSVFLWALIALGTGTALFAILMATSRGIIMAAAAAFGIWLMWRLFEINGNKLWLRRDLFFPALTLILLGAVILFLYAGPANSSSVFSDQYRLGTGSRTELFTRSTQLVLDFPFTGGGLTAFPGLYSHYLLGIPYFNVINSHNLFLDVAIEQGVLGGASFLFVYVLGIWSTAVAVVNSKTSRERMFNWLVLFGLILAFVHGMVDDYLYNGNGVLFSLALIGLSKALLPETAHRPHPRDHRSPGLIALLPIGLCMLNPLGLRSTWYANLGAVQMAKVELAGFPTNRWTDLSVLPKLEPASAMFHSALQADPANRTANHRLGLIYMIRRDFPSAIVHLERAHQSAPKHRGIIKALGYCHVWIGDIEGGSLLLTQIPEANDELDVYVWWWGTEERNDLSENASRALQAFDVRTGNP